MEGRKILRERMAESAEKLFGESPSKNMVGHQNFLDLLTPSPWIGPKIFKRFFPKVLVPDKEGRIMFRILVYDVPG